MRRFKAANNIFRNRFFFLCIDERVQLKVLKIIIIEILSARRRNISIVHTRESKIYYRVTPKIISRSELYLITFVRTKMLIKRKLFPERARGKRAIMKISSAKITLDITRNSLPNTRERHKEREKGGIFLRDFSSRESPLLPPPSFLVAPFCIFFLSGTTRSFYGTIDVYRGNLHFESNARASDNRKGGTTSSFCPR